MGPVSEVFHSINQNHQWVTKTALKRVNQRVFINEMGWKGGEQKIPEWIIHFFLVVLCSVLQGYYINCAVYDMVPEWLLCPILLPEVGLTSE